MKTADCPNESGRLAKPLFIALLLTVFGVWLQDEVSAATFYVSTNGNDAAAGTNWVTAKRTIQAGVDLAVNGDTVLVSNGVYNTGQRRSPFDPSTNRVVVTNNITLKSMNGPAVTRIEGRINSPPLDGPIRCIYMTTGTLSGFTLFNGNTRWSFLGPEDGNGAGAHAVGAVLTNCIITANFTGYNDTASNGGEGGGVYGGTLYNCTLSGNLSPGGGGGAASQSVLYDCTVTSNKANFGAGIYLSTASNTTISSNTSTGTGAGARSSTLYNSRLVGNVSGRDGGGAAFSTLYSCTISNNYAGNSAFPDGIGLGGGAYISTLTDCTINNNQADELGGGAYNSDLTDCTLKGNSAWFGGGVRGGTSLRCTIEGNFADNGGGASSATLIECMVVSNYAGQSGGGVHSGSVTDSTLIGNQAQSLLDTTGGGGGGYDATLTRCLIMNNLSPYQGGGLYDGLAANCLIRGNNSQRGGGGYRLDARNCLITDNVASNEGGGVYGFLSSDLRNCTIVGNIAGNQGGGVANSLNAFNCIIYSNSASSNANFSGGSYMNTCTAPLPGGSGNITNNPLFADSDYRLGAGSPCIDSGNNGSVVSSVDLDNRPRIISGTVDMGAYEYHDSNSSNLTWYVATNGSDIAAGTNFVTALRTIQEASDRAIDGDSVLVNDGVYDTGGAVTPGHVVTNRVVITNDITVTSVNGPLKTSITGVDNGNVNTSIRPVFITNGTLSGFTISGGRAPNIAPMSVYETGGGGAFALGGTLEYCIVKDNVGFQGGGVYGGTLINCLLSGNFSGEAGGGSYNSLLKNCTVVSNAVLGSGGGMSGGASVNSIVYFNTALSPSTSNYSGSAFSYSCTAPMPLSGAGNISDPPLFAGPDDYELGPSSPCINAGLNADASGSSDLGGRPRIVDGTVDIGAYEFRGAGSSNLIWYVAKSGSDFAAGTNWATAKFTIQGAVVQTIDGDTVFVSNGVYDTGTTITPGFSASNRVVITNDILVKSVNGAAFTSIKGVMGTSIVEGVRCVFITAGVLEGFTMTNGRAPFLSVAFEDSSGGGAFAKGGTLNDCVLTGNRAMSGGGAYGGVLNRCILIDNYAENSGILFGIGGGSRDSTQNNCVVVGNFAAYSGGGSHRGELNNCTVVDNISTNAGAGTFEAIVNNSIVYLNTSLATTNDNDSGSTFAYSCTTPLPAGAGNITNNPQFVNAGSGDYHLANTSPCADAGDNALVVGTTDVEGQPRIFAGTVDMGAFESYPLLTVTAIGGSTTGSGKYPPGSLVPISAAPLDAHWLFDQWNDGDTNLVRVITTVDSNETYIATFIEIVGNLTFYITTNGNDAASGLSWAEAWSNVNESVDRVRVGDTIILSNGTYASGGRAVGIFGITNRFVLDKAITVRSLNGPAVTIIEGSGPTNNTRSVRCAYVGTNAVLSGFTLTRGAAATGAVMSVGTVEGSGGGAWCEPLGIISNCVIRGNISSSGGGGVQGGILYNCLIVSNVSTFGLFAQGGGVREGKLYNCTVVGNLGGIGGGVYDSDMVNTICYGNSVTLGGTNYSGGGTIQYSCTTPLPAGPGNFTFDPMFVDAPNGNYALAAGSPCRDTGNNMYAAGTTDLDGNARIMNGYVDLGAYEYQGAGQGDYDGDGMGNGDEGVAGTDFANSDDVFEVAGISVMIPASIMFDSVTGRVYSADYNDALVPNPQVWIEFTNNIAGTGSPIMINDDNNATNRNYRVRVQIAP